MRTLALPTDAVIIAYDPKDGLGTLRTSEGEERFGCLRARRLLTEHVS
ncbi:hypothetical protein [Pyxidicoccus caerfyrddinensis]|nr:hypothetical protein [Pyxidicoccus caerfyrddinensis]